MDRRGWVTLGVVVVILLGAGVVSSVLAGDDPGRTEPTAYLDVQMAGAPVPADDTIAFAALSPGQQRVFEDAIEAEDGFVPVPAGVDEDVWVENRYVRHGNRTYHVAVAVP